MILTIRSFIDFRIREINNNNKHNARVVLARLRDRRYYTRTYQRYIVITGCSVFKCIVITIIIIVYAAPTMTNLPRPRNVRDCNTNNNIILLGTWRDNREREYEIHYSNLNILLYYILNIVRRERLLFSFKSYRRCLTAARVGGRGEDVI